MAKHFSKVFLAGCLSAVALSVAAQQKSAPAASTPASNAPITAGNVVVNGEKLSQEVFNRAVELAVSQGQQDTPQLRTIILEDLINRTLLAQEATKLGLDKPAEAQQRLAQARQNVLIELMLNDYFTKTSVTDADLRAEYNRQVKALGDLGSSSEFRLQIIVMKEEKEARDILRRAQKGEAFEKLAAAHSIDPSKQNGGMLEWLLPAQIIPSISNVVVNLNKGQIAASPILTPGGWHIVRVVDKRPFKAPTFEESRDALRVATINQKRGELINRLRQEAKIQR